MTLPDFLALEEFIDIQSSYRDEFESEAKKQSEINARRKK